MTDFVQPGAGHGTTPLERGSGSLFSFLRSPRQWLANRRSHGNAVATWERLKNRPKVERDPLWRDFTEAALQADTNQDSCEHDWRVNPNLVLASNPPQSQLVCAICGGTKGSGIPEGWKPPTNDPRDWIKA